MKKTIFHNSCNISSCSSEDTESTHTQSGFVSSPPPIRNSNTFDNSINVTNQMPDLLNTQSSFRKCQSFIHLSKTSEKTQSSLIDIEHCGNCNRLRKTASTPNAIYMAIKQDHQLLVHRIFNRCKVNFII